MKFATREDFARLEAMADSGKKNLFFFWDNPETFPRRFAGTYRHAKRRYDDWTITVATDDLALAVLERYWPELAVHYPRIRVPACRSDIARVALLWAYGGWYVDFDTKIVGDLRPYYGNSDVFVFVDGNRKHFERGDVLNGFMCLQRRSPLAEEMLRRIIQNVQNGTDVHRVMAFAGPYLLAELIKQSDPARVTRLMQTEVYQRHNNGFAGDAPLFLHVIDDSASSWRIVQSFGALPGHGVHWDGFPDALRPRFPAILKDFSERFGLQAEIVELARRRPRYLERMEFAEYVKACERLLASSQVPLAG